MRTESSIHVYARLTSHKNRRICALLQCKSGRLAVVAACSQRSCGPSLLMLLPSPCTKPAEQHSTEFRIRSTGLAMYDVLVFTVRFEQGLERFVADAIQ